jgi:serine protease Do
MLLVAVVSLVAGILLATGFRSPQVTSVERFWTEASAERQGQLAVPGRPASFADLVRRLKGAVVNIHTTRRLRLPKDHPEVEAPIDDGRDPHGPSDPSGGARERRFTQRNQGSGVIVHKDGYIVTNHHVVEGAEAVQVRVSTGQRYRAQVVGTDPKTDLALLRIRTTVALPAAPLGDSSTVEVGDWVVAIGNPLGFDHSVTAGIVSGKGRVLGAGPYDDFIQTDAAINPGNSGGPLFNLGGEVVGINTAVLPRSQFGFAIPSNVAKPILLQLKGRGKVIRGWLGVVVQQAMAPAADAEGFKEPRGALVSDVVPESPAQRAGIRSGDVILGFGGNPVTEVRDLPRLVAGAPVGTEAEVALFREGKRETVRIRVGELRDMPE